MHEKHDECKKGRVSTVHLSYIAGILKYLSHPIAMSQLSCENEIIFIYLQKKKMQKAAPLLQNTFKKIIVTLL